MTYNELALTGMIMELWELAAEWIEHGPFVEGNDTLEKWGLALEERGLLNSASKPNWRMLEILWLRSGYTVPDHLKEKLHG